MLPQLRMEKTDLDRVPDLPVPEGYTIRTYRRGDEAGLATVYTASDLGCATAQAVRERLVDHDYFRPERLFVAECDGQIVGTATAWEDPGPPPAGYLHMVGALPAHRGKGLGAVLTVAALRRNAAEGFTTQRLDTDDFREKAIALYLALGYVPLLTHPAHAQRWSDVGRRIGVPDVLLRARGGSMSGRGCHPGTKA